MGNRSGCHLFNGGSGLEDKLLVSGLSTEENRVLKEIYSNMKISGREMHFLMLLE
jgi:hypothetical protein